MSVAMPLSGQRVPEPDTTKSQDDEAQRLNHVQVLAISSDENEEDDVEIPEMNGYQPLPANENFNLSSEDEEENHLPPPTSTQDQSRELNVDLDLVRQAMKNIKISSIPLWAKELTDSAWDDVVKQTISGTESNTSPPSVPECSNASKQSET